MEAMIVPIFATPIYCAKIQQDPIELYHEVSKLEYTQNRNQSRSRDTFILSSFPSLLQEAQDHVQQYANAFAYEQEFVITQSWVNVCNQNEDGHLHVHPNSVFSGVIYLGEELNQTHSPIVFEKKDKFNQWWFKTTNHNWMNAIDHRQYPQVGDIILFPSDTPHRVETNKTNRTRVSIAFNTFPIGEFGSVEGLTSTVRRG